MKKVEQVEVEYVKKTTTLLISVVCLVLGFVIGMVYTKMNTPAAREVRKTTVQQPTSQPQPQPQAQADPRVAQRMAAVLQLKQMVSANPGDAASWAQLGHNYFDLGQYENAIDAYRKHLDLNPKNANVWTDMGIMYRRSKRPDEAVRCFDKAIEINPAHEQSRFNKGIVLMFDLHKHEEAIKSWQDLVKLNPNAKTPDGRTVSQFIKEIQASGQH
jgi:cytochrome c-type biogenesis protein CcmH/NrfG